MNKTLKSLLTSLLLAGGFMLSTARVTQAASFDDAVITVSPIADVSLSLNVTSYAFGPIAVNTSTNSATALTLTNNGQVSITVDKRITSESNPAGWTASATAGRDTYALYVATSTTRLSLTGFTATTKFGAQNNISNLTSTAGSTPILPPSGAGSSVDLWFRLDMPTQLSVSGSKTIAIRFTATSQ